MMNEIVSTIQAIPLGVGVVGSLIMLLSMALLIWKGEQSGRLKLLCEALVCIGGLLAAPIAIRTLLG